MGRNKQPHYRVVVADGAAPRDGRIVENLGYYKPQSTPARLILDLERFDWWVQRGAEPSDTVSSLASKARRGGDAKVALGEPDLEAAKKREADALATRRTAERKARESKAATAAAAAAPAPTEAAAAGEGEAAPEGGDEAKPAKKGKKAKAETEGAAESE
jgi:small subunit ribosomal protein S16